MSGPLLDLAKQHLKKVKTTGNTDVMAICPFHRKEDGSEERGASFSMNIYSGLWFCHSCKARGNLYAFLRDIGLSRADIQFRYKELIDLTAQYAPPPPNPLDPIEATKEPLDESFLGLFDYCPQLLLDEGFPEDLLRRFDVGFDETHMRITFPLRDASGKLVGISGRSVDGKHPRYKVYDWEYKDFGLAERKTEKRALMWNLHNVLIQLNFEKDPGSRFVVVTEGFKSVMRVAQGGIGNVVGLLGSYLSDEQLWMLGRLGCPILMMLDNNDAGRRGQVDAVQRLTSSSPYIHIIHYDADQPSDLQPEQILPALLAAQPANKWFLQQKFNPQF